MSNENEVPVAKNVLFAGPYGQLASEAGFRLPLVVVGSANGFCLGTVDEDGPVSRESVEYWPTKDGAETALAGKQGKDWTQRSEP